MCLGGSGVDPDLLGIGGEMLVLVEFLRPPRCRCLLQGALGIAFGQWGAPGVSGAQIYVLHTENMHLFVLVNEP